MNKKAFMVTDDQNCCQCVVVVDDKGADLLEFLTDCDIIRSIELDDDNFLDCTALN